MDVRSKSRRLGRRFLVTVFHRRTRSFERHVLYFLFSPDVSRQKRRSGFRRSAFPFSAELRSDDTEGSSRAETPGFSFATHSPAVSFFALDFAHCSRGLFDRAYVRARTTPSGRDSRESRSIVVKMQGSSKQTRIIARASLDRFVISFEGIAKR